jgi:hypothetical protein
LKQNAAQKACRKKICRIWRKAWQIKRIKHNDGFKPIDPRLKAGCMKIVNLSIQVIDARLCLRGARFSEEYEDLSFYQTIAKPISDTS